MFDVTGLEIGYYRSDIGLIQLGVSNEALQMCIFLDDDAHPSKSSKTPVMTECIKQLDAYFKGKNHTFSVPLKPKGTEFQQRVWQTLRHIPYGQTPSYKHVAEMIARPKAARAIGHANHFNPIAIIIPCHRVISSNGQLSGYRGGVWRKQWLIQHEKTRAKHGSK